MLKIRLIPVVLMKDGYVVQSKGFKRYQRLGNPFTIVERLSSWASDELIYLDISRGQGYDLGREDLGDPNLKTLDDIVSFVAKKCFMPLTFGGRLRSIEDVRRTIRLGADKVSINTRAIEEPSFITECSREFGAQCIVVSIDARAREDGNGWEVLSEGGRTHTGMGPAEWAARAESLGAGEILINSIDRDGSMLGYDLELLAAVSDAVSIPVIALGGVGKWEDLADGITVGNANAVAAGNIFHYTENSVYNAKKHLMDSELSVRRPDLLDLGSGIAQ